VNWIQKRSLTTRIVHTLLLTLVVGLLAIFCPTPWNLEAPGPFYQAQALVHISGAKTYPSRGRFVLLTVVSEPASLLYCLYSFFDPAARLVPRAQSGGQRDAWQMQQSQSVSSNVALAYVINKNPQLVKGLRVLDVMAGGPNQAFLRKDDSLEELDGIALHHIYGLGTILQKHPAGSHLPAVVLRAGKRVLVKLKVWQNGQRKMIGAHFSPILGSPTDLLNIRIDSEHVVGASGGLVFCLEIIDQLLPGDLTGGKVVAVTGTLDLRARVGPIEGIRYKLVAARRAGAQLFLCPKENLEELKGQHSGIPVVGVASLGEALQALLK